MNSPISRDHLKLCNKCRHDKHQQEGEKRLNHLGIYLKKRERGETFEKSDEAARTSRRRNGLGVCQDESPGFVSPQFVGQGDAVGFVFVLELFRGL